MRAFDLLGKSANAVAKLKMVNLLLEFLVEFQTSINFSFSLHQFNEVMNVNKWLNKWNVSCNSLQRINPDILVTLPQFFPATKNDVDGNGNG